MPPPTNVKAQQAILAYLDGGGTRSFAEVAESVHWLSATTVRSILHGLITSGEVDVVRMGDDSRFICYRRAESRRPFLLGEFWRTAFSAAETELHA